MAEEQAAAQAERAQNASRLITMGEMASSVAHELNQPLTAINNYCNGMVSRIKAQQIERTDLLGRLRKDRPPGPACRADHPAHPLLREAQRTQPHSRPTWQSMVERGRWSWPKSSCAGAMCGSTHYVAPRLPTLLVDPILIEQVLLNLLKNAAESIDAAQRPLAQRHVELRVAPRQSRWQRAVIEFSVTDSGHGLTPEVIGPPV